MMFLAQTEMLTRVLVHSASEAQKSRDQQNQQFRELLAFASPQRAAGPTPAMRSGTGSSPLPRRPPQLPQPPQPQPQYGAAAPWAGLQYPSQPLQPQEPQATDPSSFDSFSGY